MVLDVGKAERVGSFDAKRGLDEDEAAGND